MAKGSDDPGVAGLDADFAAKICRDDQLASLDDGGAVTGQILPPPEGS